MTDSEKPCFQEISERVLTDMQDLCETFTEACFDQQWISKSTMEALLIPMQKLDWEGKGDYAEQLKHIVETSQSEQEVIERASLITLPSERAITQRGNDINGQNT